MPLHGSEKAVLALPGIGIQSLLGEGCVSYEREIAVAHSNEAHGRLEGAAFVVCRDGMHLPFVPWSIHQHYRQVQPFVLAKGGFSKIANQDDSEYGMPGEVLWPLFQQFVTVQDQKRAFSNSSRSLPLNDSM